MHSFIGELHRQIGPGWRPWLLLLAPLLVVALVLSLPPLLKPRSSQAVGDLLAVTLAGSPNGPWHPTDLQALVPPEDYAWVQITLAIPTAAVSQQAEPLGLFLSGSFSARAYWNGTLIGEKGLPAPTAEDERPGPVDRVIFIDKTLPKAGNNTLLLEISSHYRPENTVTIIHGSEEIFGVRVAPYSAEARRSINYYIVPLLAALLLLIALAALIWRYRGHWRSASIDMVLISILLIAVCAELFRSFYAYPYQHHGYRIGIISLALSLFFILLPVQAFLYRRQTIKIIPYYNIVAWLLFANILMVLINVNYSAWFSLLAIIVCCWYWRPSIKKLQWQVLDYRFILSLVCLFIVSLVYGNERIFEDRYLYAAIIPWLAVVVLYRPTKILANEHIAEAINKDKLIVKTAGKQRLIPVADIIAVSGAGNYTVLRLTGDAELLDDRTLKVLEKELPPDFVRIHRSHIINLDCVKDLQSEGGGKYRVTLKNQNQLPVARSKIKKLRDRINQTAFGAESIK